jgi:hypothetical protein
MAIAVQVLFLAFGARTIAAARFALFALAAGGAAGFTVTGHGQAALFLFSGTCLGAVAAHHISRRSEGGQKASPLLEFLATAFIGTFLLLAAVVMSGMIITGASLNGPLAAVVAIIVCGSTCALFMAMLNADDVPLVVELRAVS